MTPDEVKKSKAMMQICMPRMPRPGTPNSRPPICRMSAARVFSGAGCGYNFAWIDPGNNIIGVNGETRRLVHHRSRRWTSAADQTSVAVGNPYLHYGENPENQTLAERCLSSFGNSAGPVMLPLLYNNNYEIAQSKDTVAIVVEMVHDVRIIRIGGKAPHRWRAPLDG